MRAIDAKAKLLAQEKNDREKSQREPSNAILKCMLIREVLTCLPLAEEAIVLPSEISTAIFRFVVNSICRHCRKRFPGMIARKFLILLLIVSQCERHRGILSSRLQNAEEYEMLWL
jgi:hypothetical protein